MFHSSGETGAETRTGTCLTPINGLTFQSLWEWGCLGETGACPTYLSVFIVLFRAYFTNCIRLSHLAAILHS